MSLALLVRELIPEESLHWRLKNTLWDPNSWSCQATEQYSRGVSEFWGNHSVDKLPVFIKSCVLLIISHFHWINPYSRSCFHVCVQVCLQQSQGSSFLGLKKLLLLPISCTLLVQLNFSKWRHFTNSDFCHQFNFFLFLFSKKRLWECQAA